MPQYGPTQPFSEQVHAEKYRGKGETFKEAMNRIAGALEDSDDHFRKFRETLLEMRFLPGGRIQNAVGSTKHCTAYNCFVSGKIEDSFVEGHGSIMDRATEAVTTMRMGGGIGYDFSTLRPRGSTIHKLQSQSSGPVSFMEIFDAICRCVASSGHRRGAQMGLMRIDHPDIEDFIRAKQPPKAADPIMRALSECEPGSVEWLEWYNALQAVYNLTGFNVSVCVTNEFMEALVHDRPFDLRFGGRTHRQTSATALWDMLMRSTWDWAEPGIIFIDTINRMNNLWYCEEIIGTNPCGEQPLPPYGACLLGSFNLTKYVRAGANWYLDLEQLKADIPHVVRAMDNVINRATYPLYEQEREAKQKRRMGIGVTGLANALEAMGLPYGSEAFLRYEANILQTITNEAYRASAMLAQEKGTFPLYDRRYLSGPFIQQLDEDVREMIGKYGIRNSHLTSIAPTGTISICADNVSSGIEPVFSYVQRRQVNMPSGTVETELEDYGYRVFGTEGKRCQDVTIQEHLDVLDIATRCVDSSVSKTCNVSSSTPWKEFKNLYVDAWQRGCKGLTTYQVGGKRAGIIKSVDTGKACRIDGQTGRRECE